MLQLHFWWNPIPSGFLEPTVRAMTLFGSSASLGARGEEGFGILVPTLSFCEQIYLMNEIKELGRKFF